MRHHRVLVVDDELAQRLLYCRLLESGGFATAQAESGAKAIESIKNERPKLIVADISMPGMDGIQLYKALRHDKRTSDIPFLLMTGMPIQHSLLHEACIGLEMSEIFVKGGDSAHFIALASKLLRTPISPSHGTAPAPAERIAINSTQRRIWIDGRELPRLPSKRYDLLVQLLQERMPQSCADLLRSVWPESDSVKIVGVNILRLRRDLRSFSAIRIQTTPDGYAALLDP